MRGQPSLGDYIREVREGLLPMLLEGPEAIASETEAAAIHPVNKPSPQSPIRDSFPSLKTLRVKGKVIS